MAQLRSAEKQRKYTELAALNEYELCGFTAETYGGLAPEAHELLRDLASLAPDEWSNFIRASSSRTHTAPFPSRCRRPIPSWSR